MRWKRMYLLKLYISACEDRDMKNFCWKMEEKYVKLEAFL